jgi:O-antigen ligase
MVSSAPEPRPRRRRRAAVWSASRWRLALLATLVLGAVSALGAQDPWSLAALAAGSTVLAALSLGALSRVPRLFWLFTAAVAFTLLQLVPIPLGWVTSLSPAAGEIWRSCLSATKAAPPGWVSLSIDPQATALEAAKWWTYGAVFLGAVAVRRERGAAALAAIIAGSAVLVTLVTLAHGVLDLQKVYGLHQPSFGVDRWQRGPLLNSNNLASYLTLGLGALGGMLLSRRVKGSPRLLLVATLLMVPVLLLTGSRAGLAAFLLMLFGFSLVVMRGGRNRGGQRWALVAVAVLLLGLLAAMAVAGDRLLGDWLGQDTTRKLAAWRWTVDLLREYPWFGVGRGAYETAFPAYRGYLGYDWTSVFSHPENLPLQWLSEWGLLFGGAALVSFVVLLGSAIRRALTGETAALGVALGVCAALVQNLADLGSEVAGVMIAIVVGLAAFAPDAEQRLPRRPSRLWRQGLLIAAGVGFVLLALARGRSPARDERAEFALRYRELAPADRGTRETFREGLLGAILRHPAEPYFQLLGGLVAHRAGDQNPVAWLGQALERAPTAGTVHLALADVLAARGARSQALIHLRLASQYDATLRASAVAGATRWAKNVDELVRAFPESAAGKEQLATACRKLEPSPFVVECWRRVAQANGDELAYEELARVLGEATRRQEEPCLPAVAEACRREVAEIAKRLDQRGRPSWRVSAVQADLLDEGPEKRREIGLLLDRCPGGLAAADCVRRTLDLAKAAKDSGVVTRALERLLAVACSGDSECAEAHDRAAGEYAELGAWSLSLKHRQEAARALPTAERWLAVADAAQRARAVAVATVALQRAEGFVTLTEQERADLATIRGRLGANQEAGGD